MTAVSDELNAGCQFSFFPAPLPDPPPGGEGDNPSAISEHHREADLEQGVMVDVGPGTGALVIYTDDGMRGEEIEISPTRSDSQRVHTDVLRRRTAGGFVCAAVFGSLAEADYNLWHESRPGPETVSVVGGRVTEVDWR